MIGEVTFGVIGLLFLFADIRTFASTFQLTFFGAPNTQLGIMAASVFATSFLGLLVAWRLGPRRALGVSAVLLAAATLLATMSRNNWTDLLFSVVALAAGFWWLAFLHSARAGESASPLPRALPIAFACDLALRAATRTVAVPDLAWPVAVGVVLAAVLVFAASGLASLAAQRQWSAPDLRGTLGLLAVPCLILVAETGGTNGAQASAAAGLGLGPEPVRATQIGQLVLGLGIAAGALALSRLPAKGLVAAAAIVAGAAVLWLHVPLVSLAGAAVLAAGVVLAAAALLGGPLHPSRSAAGVVLPLSLGWLLFVGTAFGFYAFWAYLPAVYAATAIVALGCAVAAGGARLGRPVAMGVMALVVAVPLVAVLTTASPAASEPLRRTFRFMTYNVHQGFDAGQIPSLDELVQAISAESPDVVCLQEVVRGWMIDQQHDTLSVLAERLGMQYAFIPNIGDLYGNAVLTRAPMSGARFVRYAREPSVKHQPRGALFVDIEGPDQRKLLVACTHLDEVEGADSVRQEQVRAIIREWDFAPVPIIVAGDLNATPETIEIRLLNEAGLDDLGREAGDTTTMSDPQKRIDYIWGKGVAGSQAHTPATVEAAMRASDHRWLAVNITWEK